MKLIARALFVLIATCPMVWPLAAAGGVLIVEKTMTAGSAQTHHIQIGKDWMRMEQTSDLVRREGGLRVRRRQAGDPDR